MAVERGQIWQLGKHRLMCGDATSRQDLIKLLGEAGHADFLLTDPPYGIGAVERNGARTYEGCIVPAHDFKPVMGDDSTETAKLSYEAQEGLTDNQVIFGGNCFADFLPISRCWIVWDKHTGTSSFSDAELAWTSFDRPVKLYDWLWSGMCRKGDRKSELRSRVHPTQKPVGLIELILRDFTAEGASVLDPFGGSGSTLIACEKAGRKCYMMEYDSEYVSIILNRWEDYTGNTAIPI